MKNSLLDLSRDVWGIILSFLPIHEIFGETLLISSLRKIVISPSFRLMIMQQHKYTHDVYNISSETTHLPAETHTPRFIQKRCLCCDKFSCWCEIYKQEEEKLLNNLPHSKLYYQEGFNEEYSQDAYSQQKNRHRRFTHFDIHDVRKIHLKETPFQHKEWKRHNISQITHIFNLSEETKHSENNLVYNKEGKPINFPKPNKIEPHTQKLEIDYKNMIADRKNTWRLYNLPFSSLKN